MTLYIAVFSLALTELSKHSCSADAENQISEKLCPILTRVCFTESQKRNYEVRTPDWELPIQPVIDAELKDGRGGKRPDFTCKCTNRFASDAEQYEIALHIECKLLGKPASEHWIYNRNYTAEGIERFDSPTHEYGKRAPAGMMIGYIVSMRPELIVTEVNKYQQERLPYNPALALQFNNPPVYKGRQNLNRGNVSPEKFQLIHLWVDLRG